jgi:hypothetical protein
VEPHEFGFRCVAFIACTTAAITALSQPSGAPTSRPAAESTPPARRHDGQQDSTEGAVAILVGPALLDVSSLNARLRDNGYQGLGALSALVGFEGVGVFASGLVVGARVGAILNPSGAGPDGEETHLCAGFGTLDFGFAFIRTAPLLLTVTAGGGWYVMTLDVSDDESVPFDDVLTNPRHSASLSRGGVLAGLTLSMDWRIGQREHDSRTFLTLGARVGGLYGPPMGEWSLASGAKADDGPKLGLRGGFVVLALGFGSGPPRR